MLRHETSKPPIDARFLSRRFFSAFAMILLCAINTHCHDGVWHGDSVESLLLDQNVTSGYYTLMLSGSVDCTKCDPARTSMIIELSSNDRLLTQPIVSGLFNHSGNFALAGTVDANESLTVQAYYVSNDGIIHNAKQDLHAPDKPDEGVANVAITLQVP